MIKDSITRNGTHDKGGRMRVARDFTRFRLNGSDCLTLTVPQSELFLVSVAKRRFHFWIKQVAPQLIEVDTLFLPHVIQSTWLIRSLPKWVSDMS